MNFVWCSLLHIPGIILTCRPRVSSYFKLLVWKLGVKTYRWYYLFHVWNSLSAQYTLFSLCPWPDTCKPQWEVMVVYVAVVAGRVSANYFNKIWWYIEKYQFNVRFPVTNKINCTRQMCFVYNGLSEKKFFYPVNSHCKYKILSEWNIPKQVKDNLVPLKLQ